MKKALGFTLLAVFLGLLGYSIALLSGAVKRNVLTWPIIGTVFAIEVILFIWFLLKRRSVSEDGNANSNYIPFEEVGHPGLLAKAKSFLEDKPWLTQGALALVILAGIGFLLRVLYRNASWFHWFVNVVFDDYAFHLREFLFTVSIVLILWNFKFRFDKHKSRDGERARNRIWMATFLFTVICLLSILPRYINPRYSETGLPRTKTVYMTESEKQSILAREQAVRDSIRDEYDRALKKGDTAYANLHQRFDEYVVAKQKEIEHQKDSMSDDKEESLNRLRESADSARKMLEDSIVSLQKENEEYERQLEMANSLIKQKDILIAQKATVINPARRMLFVVFLFLGILFLFLALWKRWLLIFGIAGVTAFGWYFFRYHGSNLLTVEKTKTVEDTKKIDDLQKQLQQCRDSSGYYAPDTTRAAPCPSVDTACAACSDSLASVAKQLRETQSSLDSLMRSKGKKSTTATADNLTDLERKLTSSQGRGRHLYPVANNLTELEQLLQKQGSAPKRKCRTE